MRVALRGRYGQFAAALMDVVVVVDDVVVISRRGYRLLRGFHSWKRRKILARWRRRRRGRGRREMQRTTPSGATLNGKKRFRFASQSQRFHHLLGFVRGRRTSLPRLFRRSFPGRNRSDGQSVFHVGQFHRLLDFGRPPFSGSVGTR